jgi:hypothetical protein
MVETEVVIEFLCCHCCHEVIARLKCSGNGVAKGPHAIAGVPLRCPTCHQVNQVCFELSGLVLQVSGERRGQPLLEPSLN